MLIKQLEATGTLNFFCKHKFELLNLNWKLSSKLLKPLDIPGAWDPLLSTNLNLLEVSVELFKLNVSLLLSIESSLRGLVVRVSRLNFRLHWQVPVHTQGKVTSWLDARCQTPRLLCTSTLAVAVQLVLRQVFMLGAGLYLTYRFQFRVRLGRHGFVLV